MTFSIAGRCAMTGAFGLAIATSSIAVGARCAHARAGTGAAATQNVTDPAVGPLLLDFMRAGLSAPQAIAKSVAGRAHIDYRQLTAVDREGRTASWTGRHVLGRHAVCERQDCVAAGNIGCISQLEGADAPPIVHTIELLNWAYGGACPPELWHLAGRIRSMHATFAEQKATAAEPATV